MMTRLSHCSLALCEESYKRVPGSADVAGFKWTEMCTIFFGQGMAAGWHTKGWVNEWVGCKRLQVVGVTENVPTLYFSHWSCKKTMMKSLNIVDLIIGSGRISNYSSKLYQVVQNSVLFQTILVRFNTSLPMDNVLFRADKKFDKKSTIQNSWLRNGIYECSIFGKPTSLKWRNSASAKTDPSWLPQPLTWYSRHVYWF